MGFCTNLSRIGLIIFNLLFAAGGLAILIAGIVFRVDEQYEFAQNTAIGIIVMGSFVLVVALFGLFGALRRVKALLWIYLILLILILIGQITVAVIAATNRSLIENEAVKLWNDSDAVAPEIQTRFNCCGLYNNTYLPKDDCEVNNPNAPGCYEQLLVLFDQYYTAVLVSAAVLAAIEIFGILFALILVCSKKEDLEAEMEMK